MPVGATVSTIVYECGIKKTERTMAGYLVVYILNLGLQVVRTMGFFAVGCNLKKCGGEIEDSEPSRQLR